MESNKIESEDESLSNPTSNISDSINNMSLDTLDSENDSVKHSKSQREFVCDKLTNTCHLTPYTITQTGGGGILNNMAGCGSSLIPISGRAGNKSVKRKRSSVSKRSSNKRLVQIGGSKVGSSRKSAKTGTRKVKKVKRRVKTIQLGFGKRRKIIRKVKYTKSQVGGGKKRRKPVKKNKK